MGMHLKKYLSHFALTLCSFAFGDSAPPTPLSPEPQVFDLPWTTGPLLVTTPFNLQLGHPAVSPTLAIFATYGRYNNDWKIETQSVMWSINPYINFECALTERTGFQIVGSFTTNIREGQCSTHLQDTLVQFGYQILSDTPGTWRPNCRLILEGIFPSGNYNDLDPKKLQTDSTGLGSYQFGPLLVLSKLFPVGHHYLNLYWSFAYLFPTSVKVKGFNAYGGGYGTKGEVRTGQSMIFFFSGEYSINQRWTFAFDSEWLFQRKSPFSGKPGLTASGKPAEVGWPNIIQFSLAPQIEYNFSARSGLLGGLWFTLAGKNASAFGSAFLSYIYVF